MTEKELSELQPGDKVRIVDSFTYECNAVPEMEMYLSQIVTVAEYIKYAKAIHICEDDCHWFWYPPAIERVEEIAKPMDHLLDDYILDLERQNE